MLYTLLDPFFYRQLQAEVYVISQISFMSSQKMLVPYTIRTNVGESQQTGRTSRLRVLRHGFGASRSRQKAALFKTRRSGSVLFITSLSLQIFFETIAACIKDEAADTADRFCCKEHDLDLGFDGLHQRCCATVPPLLRGQRMTLCSSSH